MKELRVIDIIGSPSAITSKKGEMLYNALKEYIQTQTPVSVSFEGIENCASAFINSSIGKLYMDFGEKSVSGIVNISDVESDVWLYKISCSIELGTDENLRNAHDNTLNELLYS